MTLPGCSSIGSPERIVLSPPDALMQDCVEVSAPTRPISNTDLLRYALDLRTGLRVCNADKAGLRAWIKVVQ